MTKQELFDKIVIGLDAQDWERSTKNNNHGSDCMYRGDHGRKCAVGHIISDEEYDADMDIILNGIEALNDEHCLFNNEDIPFLEESQVAHDNTDSPEEREMEFRELAKIYELKWPK